MTKLLEPGQLPAPDELETYGEQVCYIGSGDARTSSFAEWCWITRRYPDRIYVGTRVAIGVQAPYGVIHDPDNGTELGGTARATGIVIAVNDRCARVEFDKPLPVLAYGRPGVVHATDWVWALPTQDRVFSRRLSVGEYFANKMKTP